MCVGECIKNLRIVLNLGQEIQIFGFKNSKKKEERCLILEHYYNQHLEKLSVTEDGGLFGLSVLEGEKIKIQKIIKIFKRDGHFSRYSHKNLQDI